MPFIARALLKAYGRRTTCLAFVSPIAYSERQLTTKQAVAYTLLLSCAVPFIKPRLPLPRKQASSGSFPMRILKGRPSTSDRHRRVPTERATGKWRCLRSSTFWLLFTGVLLQGLGGFVPGTYLPCRFQIYCDTARADDEVRLAFATAIHLSAPVATLSIALSKQDSRGANDA